MKFAICNELYGDWPIEKAFAHARNCGYQGVELAPFTLHDDPAKISATRRTEIRELAKQNELEIVGLHWLLAKTTGYHATHPDADVRRQTWDYVGELATLCKDLGGKVMVFGSPQQRNLVEGVTHDEAFSYFVAGLKQIDSALQDCNVVLALEPLGPKEGDFMLTAESAIELIKAADSSNIQLHLDVKAMSTESKPIREIIHEGAEWLVHFHANDPNRRGPGMGDVDFVPIFQALKEVGYDDWLSVEVFDYEPGIERLATESLEYLNEMYQRTFG